MPDNKDQDRIGGRASNDRHYRGDGPGKIGLTDDKQRNLVAPNGVNEGEHGAADEAPMAGNGLGDTGNRPGTPS